MAVDSIHNVLLERVHLDPNDDFGIQECWNTEIRILTMNVDETIYFFENECSDEEFFWLSEVFDDVSKILQSKEFVETLKKRLTSVTKDGYIQNQLKDEFMRQNISYSDYIENITMEIEYAEGAIADSTE